jgi:predicted dienelactone hydrolase
MPLLTRATLIYQRRSNRSSKSTFLLAATVLSLVRSSLAYQSMSYITERNGGTITVSPRNEADQSALVVISHGLGDTAEGFADVAEVRRKFYRCSETTHDVWAD